MTKSATMDELREAMAKAVAPELMRLFDGEAPHRTERPDYWRIHVSDKDKEQVRSLMAAALTAIREAGCAVVPREPSDVMIEKGADAFADEFGTAPFDRQDDMGSAVNIYRAMLAASEVTG